MASEYNSRLLVPEVMVSGDHFDVVRARPSFDEMLKRDTIPGMDRAEGLTRPEAGRGGSAERMRAERRASRGRDPLARVLWRSRAAMALESFTRAFWPLGSAAGARLGGAGLRARRGHHAAAAHGRDGRRRARASRAPHRRAAPLPLAERGRRAGADRRDAARAAAGGAGRPAGARARRPRRAGGLGGAPGADAPDRGHRPAGRWRTCGWRRTTPGRCGWWRWWR